ncbi:MAG: hypothetical protein B7Y56_04925 [Gallionellales bacterium 35-53-114]|nr:MAG: hypothetical protein B7Y56_04925 [Gallionellales bacterium 35-53-114]OYZ65429.1 MAG: hypothetical protein B7Y04_02080 [Gallionellales bacterium 24-53-125]OZB08335.1 MAG: hypothetical protein B7X61_12535 [Gallionellales bacterium 39-52-133]HQS58276.1 hypothetical protein [Gallionellaceae bacterium]HQS73831.1 hypothetical protein [Gallionellaceae bacterium]
MKHIEDRHVRWRLTEKSASKYKEIAIKTAQEKYRERHKRLQVIARRTGENRKEQLQAEFLQAVQTR